MGAIETQHWGRLAYAAALERQERLFERRCAGACGDVIVCVEHPPTITLGRHAPEDDLLADTAALARRSVALVRTDRGGRATYHGPGQAVVYPIVDIAARGLGARQWVDVLQDAIVASLSGFGVRAACRSGTAGLWTGRGKIASIGLRIRRGVSTHGLSLNVGLDVGGFSDIVTCGVPGEAVTSIAAEGAREPSLEEVWDSLCARITQRLETSSR